MEKAKAGMTEWERRRFKRMDAALTEIDAIPAAIMQDLREIAAAVRELDKFSNMNARRAIGNALATELERSANGVEYIGEVVNKGLTVPEAET